MGRQVGRRSAELIFWRERPGRRETKLLQALMFVHTQVWKALFGKQADSLEKSTENADECKLYGR